MARELDRADLLRRARSVAAAGMVEQRYRIDVEYADALPIGARSIALLRSCIALVDTDETAGLGVLVRAIYEEWLFGLLYLQGTHEDRMRLRGAHFHDLDKLARLQEQPRPEVPNDITMQVWKIEARSRRLDQIRGTGTATTYYNDFYRTESFAAAHAGFGTNRQHVGEQPDGVAILAYADDADVTLARLAIALVLVAQLMSELWKRCELDPLPFDEAAAIEVGDDTE